MAVASAQGREHDYYRRSDDDDDDDDGQKVEDGTMIAWLMKILLSLLLELLAL